ncbi:hypothetical protein LT493_15275 [Streptomyces tricolor]|nr:hypothetical protein [Streptomyces tricolor]
MIEWSWELLTGQERTLARRMAVFPPPAGARRRRGGLFGRDAAGRGRRLCARFAGRQVVRGTGRRRLPDAGDRAGVRGAAAGRGGRAGSGPGPAWSVTSPT